MSANGDAEGGGGGGGGGGGLSAFATQNSQRFVLLALALFVWAVVAALVFRYAGGLGITGGGLDFGIISGAWGLITGVVSWVMTTAPAGSTPLPVIGVEIPNMFLTVLAMLAVGFVVMDRATGGFRTGGIPYVRDVADLSRAALVFFFAWLVYIRADSMLDLVYWLAITIPFAVIAVVAYTYFQKRRDKAKRSTAATHTPPAARERIEDLGQIATSSIVAVIVGLFAVLQVALGSIGALGEVALAISSETIYSVVIWIGYTSLGGSFGSELLPSFTAEQFVFAAAVLGAVALVLQRRGI